MRTQSVRWVSHLLTVYQKLERLNISQSCLERFKQNENDFLRFISVDETWVHHYTPEAKAQSKKNKSDWIGINFNPN